MGDPNPCEAIDCNEISQPLDVCGKERRCPHAWTKQARLDREEREAKDANRRADE